ncbi:deoxyuridine 5'-triphosphate nucleotidohydrolase [bacterium K02(2017)]|nr:deoxyuridine 5'-triphosphate nucleotidohydrolase [bacterium K02(2017)]
MKIMDLKIKRVRDNDDLALPQYQSEAASGMDLLADIKEKVIIKPGQRHLVPTGISIEFPIGYEAQVRARSGLAIKKGISLVNGPGTIDADYRGEIAVILINHGTDDFLISRGDRIAQLVISPVIQANIIEVDTLLTTTRGEGGFGSTG